MRGRSWASWVLVAGLLALMTAAGIWSAATSPSPPRHDEQVSASSSMYTKPPITHPPMTTAPVPTSSSLPSPTVAVQAVALAQMGQRLSYVATYRITQTLGGIDPTTMVVTQMGNPEGGWPSDWSYRLEWSDGSEFELEAQPGGPNGLVYKCGLPSPTSTWSCYGPIVGLGGNYGHSLVELYEPMTQYGFLQATLSDQSDIGSTAYVADEQVDCLTSGPSQTWCLTSLGLFASFPAEEELGPWAHGLAGQLLSWSGQVTPEQLDLPALPSTTISPVSACVEGGPC